MDLAGKDLKRRIVKVVTVLIIASLMLSFSVLIFLLNSGTSLFAISGTSMEPTLKSRDSVILKQEDAPEQNQIAFFNKPKSWEYMGEDESVLVKRIAAAPGDTLEFDGQSFIVNGEVFYSIDTDDYSCESGTVGYKHTLTKNEVFAMGDNARVSLDSRRIFCDGNTDHIYIPSQDMIDFGHILMKF